MTRAKKIILILASVTIILAVFGIALLNFVLPQIKYNDALLLMKQEKYEDAIDAFSETIAFRDSAQKIYDCEQSIKEEIYLDARSAELLSKYELAFSTYTSLGDYKDSLTRKERMRVNMQSNSLRNARINSTVYFGLYEQDNNLENGKEPIKWYVISAKGNYLQLLAVNALDAKQYHQEYKAIKWENSSIRNWLNNDFYNTAFTRSERDIIVPWWNVSEGRNGENAPVVDNVFLLTSTEVKTVVPEKFSQCIPTPYAIAQGVYQSPDGDQCRWILRTPGEFMFNVQCVYFDGTIFARGNDVNYQKDGLRPSLWVNKNAVNYA